MFETCTADWWNNVQGRLSLRTTADARLSGASEQTADGKNPHQVSEIQSEINGLQNGILGLIYPGRGQTWVLSRFDPEDPHPQSALIRTLRVGR